MKGTVLAEQSTFQSVSRLLPEEIPWNSIFITFRACATNIPSLVEIRRYVNVGHFIWRSEYVFVCISASTGENSLELHINNFPRMRYKHCKFGCNRWIMKGTLLGERRTLSCVSQLLLREISCSFILFTFRACPINTGRLVALDL
jgi:hypothetical protein